MNSRSLQLEARLTERFAGQLRQVTGEAGDSTWELDKENLLEVVLALRDDDAFQFEMLIDLCGVDYLSFGESEWQTESATDSGFSRGVTREVIVPDAETEFDPQRFAVVYHLLSVSNNQRIRLRVFAGDQNPPMVFLQNPINFKILNHF